MILSLILQQACSLLGSLAYITHTVQSKKALQETVLIEKFG